MSKKVIEELEKLISEQVNPRSINIDKLSVEEKKKITGAFQQLIEAERKKDKKLEEKARKELDNVVFDILGLAKQERQQVYEALKMLREMRLK
ncbi:MAG: hypothetical protein DRZ82_09735, partial [Thermoprotei archaeon]